MGVYERRILPWLLDLAMRQQLLEPHRRRIVAKAAGRVLEIGVGSGLNLPLYGAAAREIIGLDSSPELLDRARQAARRAGNRVTLVDGSAEALPVEDRSIDTVLTTWTLCSIRDVARALAEVRRVLRPDGQLLFVEHGRAPDAGVARWQDRLTPLWRRLAGGCHLNRPIGTLIAEAGFAIDELDTGYIEGPKALTFTYEGRARVTPRSDLQARLKPGPTSRRLD